MTHITSIDNYLGRKVMIFAALWL